MGKFCSVSTLEGEGYSDAHIFPYSFMSLSSYPLIVGESLCFSPTDADGPAPLELPNQWLWDIIDEFIYQVHGLLLGLLVA